MPQGARLLPPMGQEGGRSNQKPQPVFQCAQGPSLGNSAPQVELANPVEDSGDPDIAEAIAFASGNPEGVDLVLGEPGDAPKGAASVLVKEDFVTEDLFIDSGEAGESNR